MKKRNNGTNLKLVQNQTTTSPVIESTPESLPEKATGYGQKPWNRLAEYVDRRESYLIEQAQSIVRRNFTADEAKLLFQYIDINSREPFPETDLPASREQPRPGFWIRWFGGKVDLSAEP